MVWGVSFVGDGIILFFLVFCEFRGPAELNTPQPSEAVFADDPLRFRGVVLVGLVHVGAVDHDDLVGVLLNGAGVAQVGNDRFALGVPGSFFHVAVELGRSEEHTSELQSRE